jgi:hypothetical protein
MCQCVAHTCTIYDKNYCLTSISHVIPSLKATVYWMRCGAIFWCHIIAVLNLFSFQRLHMSTSLVSLHLIYHKTLWIPLLWFDVPWVLWLWPLLTTAYPLSMFRWIKPTLYQVYYNNTVYWVWLLWMRELLNVYVSTESILPHVAYRVCRIMAWSQPHICSAYVHSWLPCIPQPTLT